MIVIWSENAENTLKETAEYIFERFGEKNMKNFLQEVFKTAKLLETSPYIGQI